MEQSAEINIPDKAISYSKLSAFVKLTKIRLSFLVVLSAVITYFTLVKQWDPMVLTGLIIGGFFVTGASNGFNQIIEKDLDKLMVRTQNRPLPKQILVSREAAVFCGIGGLAGVAVLYLMINPMAGILGVISMLLYTIAYTPMKRISPFAVFVGAFPGALPVLIGATAATDGFGSLEFPAWVLFFLQFMWQFPHFWAIAWVSHEDYQRAGFYMLPSRGGKNKSSAFQIVIYTLFLLPVGILPSLFGICDWSAGMVVLAAGLVFLVQSVRLYVDLSVDSARKLMFGSFFYLPIVQLAIMIGRL